MSIALGVIGLVFLQVTGFLRVLSTPATTLLTGVGATLYGGKMRIGEFMQGAWCKDSGEKDKLSKEVLALTAENARLKIAESENILLRAQLNFLQTSAQKYAIANVAGQSSDPYSSMLIIDKGSKDGIRENLAVTTNEGIIIGKTSYVKETSSQVILLNDSRSKLLVMVPGRKDGTGIIEGKFGLGLGMSLIPITSELHNDDMVVTSGLEPDIPPGLMVGRIASLEFQSSDLFKRATLKSMVHYGSVRIVSVLLPR